MESLKNNLNLWDGTLRNGSGSNNDNVSKEGDLAAKWTIDDLPRVFQLETTNTQEGQDRDDLSVDRKFKLRDGIQSWFYISTLPCEFWRTRIQYICSPLALIFFLRTWPC